MREPGNSNLRKTGKLGKWCQMNSSSSEIESDLSEMLKFGGHMPGILDIKPPVQSIKPGIKLIKSFGKLAIIFGK